MNNHLEYHYRDINNLVLTTQCEHRCIHELAYIIEKGEFLGKQYREKIKRNYRLKIWNDKAMVWLAEQNKPVKVEFT